MDSFEKLKTLYKSGRFECDLFFYSKLYEIANELNLYEQLDAIQKNKAIVEKTAQLTKRHLVALEEEDNQEKALEIIKQVNKHVAQIDTSFVKPMLQTIESMGGKSYQTKIITYIKSQPSKKLYTETFDRIFANVHDLSLRLQDLLLMSIFMSKNGEKIENFVKIYGNVLEHGVGELKKFRGNFQFVSANPELQEHQKVKNYFKGSQVIIACLMKFNQIYKLLSGDSKFGIKLNAYRKDIQVCLSKNDEAPQNPKAHPYKEFKAFLTTGQPLPHICSLCLCLGEDHPECLNTIKLLYSKPHD